MALVLGGALVPVSADAARSGESDRHAPKPTVVLVHGVFADASGWYETVKRLQKDGYEVIAPANPLRDLDGDAAYVSSVLDSIDGPIILVGHSYGGEVLTNAARGHANVKALVYIAAFAPDQGESALQLAGQFPGRKLPEALVTRDYPVPVGGPGKDGYIDPAKFRDVFAADLPAKETRLMAAAQQFMARASRCGPRWRRSTRCAPPRTQAGRRRNWPPRESSRTVGWPSRRTS